MAERRSRVAGVIRSLLLVTVAFAGVIPLAGCLPVSLTGPDATGPVVSEDAAGQTVEIIRIVDGDTVAIRPSDQFPASNDEGTEHIVRLLGIDTPELNVLSEEAAECGATEAQHALDQFLDQTVLLVRDPVTDPVDRYGRTLAYLETAEGLDLSAEQVRAGWAEPYHPASEPEPSRFQMYLPLAEQAEAQQVGVWQLCS